MRKISINDWRYKLIKVIFGMSEYNLPKNTCEFYFYTILGVILYPFYYIPELIFSIATTDWTDLRNLTKLKPEGETYYVSTHPIRYLLVSFILVVFSILVSLFICLAFIPFFPVVDIYVKNMGASLLAGISFLLMPVYALIIQLVVRIFRKCKEYCKPIEYTEGYEYYDNEDYSTYVKNPVLEDESKLYYEGAGPNWDEDDNDKRFFKIFITSELKHNKEEWANAGLKEGAVLTDDVFEEATKKAFNR